MIQFDKLYRGDVGKRDAAPSPAAETLPPHMAEMLDRTLRDLKRAVTPAEKALAKAQGERTLAEVGGHELLKALLSPHHRQSAADFFGLGQNYAAGR